jgi:hypothetical protein
VLVEDQRHGFDKVGTRLLGDSVVASQLSGVAIGIEGLSDLAFRFVRFMYVT